MCYKLSKMGMPRNDHKNQPQEQFGKVNGLNKENKNLTWQKKTDKRMKVTCVM